MGFFQSRERGEGGGDKKRFRTSLFTLANETIVTQSNPVLNNIKLLGQRGMKAGVPTTVPILVLFCPALGLIFLN